MTSQTNLIQIARLLGREYLFWSTLSQITLLGSEGKCRDEKGNEKSEDVDN